MKKFLRISVIVLVLTLFMATGVLAKSDKGNPKGVVTELNEGARTLTIETRKGETVVVLAPEGFDFLTVAVGDTVMAKGVYTEAGLEAEWVKVFSKDKDEEVDDPEEEEEGSKGGYYCQEGAEKVHPVAEKIVEKYGVTVEWVMSYVCDGYGYGAVMLALQTEEAGGGSADDLLVQKKEGKGWGQLWKEGGLVGSDKADHAPPGLLKKPDKQTGPPDWANNDKDKEKSPEEGDGD